MGIQYKGNLSELKARMNTLKARVDQAIFMRLSKIGEDLVTYAKSIPKEVGYEDQTGNLRSSTGYIVVKDGEILTAKFKDEPGRDNSKKKIGANVGFKHAESIAKEHNTGYVLIVVAGMDYALALESMEKDVLTTTEYLARKKMPIEVQRLRENIKKMKL